MCALLLKVRKDIIFRSPRRDFPVGKNLWVIRNIFLNKKIVLPLIRAVLSLIGGGYCKRSLFISP